MTTTAPHEHPTLPYHAPDSFYRGDAASRCRDLRAEIAAERRAERTTRRAVRTVANHAAWIAFLDFDDDPAIRRFTPDDMASPDPRDDPAGHLPHVERRAWTFARTYHTGTPDHVVTTYSLLAGRLYDRADDLHARAHGLDQF